MVLGPRPGREVDADLGARYRTVTGVTLAVPTRTAVSTARRASRRDRAVIPAVARRLPPASVDLQRSAGHHLSHRHVIGLPVRTCAAVLQRTAYTRPELGPRLAALPAWTEAGPAAPVAADATGRQRPCDNPRLARRQRPLAGTRWRRNNRGLPAQPHQADPARHHFARQRTE